MRADHYALLDSSIEKAARDGYLGASAQVATPAAALPIRDPDLVIRAPTWDVTSVTDLHISVYSMARLISSVRLGGEFRVFVRRFGLECRVLLMVASSQRSSRARCASRPPVSGVLGEGLN
jgi:hypothetical protein